MSWPTLILLVVVGGCLGLYALLLLAIFVTHLIEKRRARDLVPAAADDPEQAKLASHGSTPGPVIIGASNPYAGPELVDYALKQNRKARELGLTCHGLFKDATARIHWSRTALWTTPARDVLAVVSWERLLGIKVNKTLLYTRLADGRYLVTADTPGGIATPGLYDLLVPLNADFPSLLSRHQQRIDACGGAVVPFEGGDASAAHESIRAARHAILVARGEAYYTSEDRTAIRSTLKGAFAAVARTWGVSQYVERPGTSASNAPGQRQRAPKFLVWAEWACLFMLAFTVVRMRNNPATTEAQRLFRLGILVLGIAGLVTIYILKSVLKNKDN